jgi:predicted O-methyltransferase YrrM
MVPHRALVPSDSIQRGIAYDPRLMSRIMRRLRRLRIRVGPDGRDILRLHEELEGQLSMQESAWLYNAARDHRTIVEIGSYRGKSCVLLGMGSQAVDGRITAIDPHLPFDDGSGADYGAEDHEVLLDTVRRHGIAERVTPVLKTSRDALPEWGGDPVDLLWVDGDHRYEAVRFDLAEWGKLVRVGGTVAAHDYTHREGVRRAWDEVIGADRRFGPTQQVRSIAWTTRIGAPSS